jgi:hypothetical protein
MSDVVAAVAAGGSSACEFPGLGEDLAEVVAHRAILVVTGESVAAATRAVDAGVGRLGPKNPSVVQVVPSASADRAAFVRAFHAALRPRRLQPRGLAEAEDLIVGELRRAPRVVVLPAAHEVRTAGLGVLYGMWARLVPGGFPLVLAGDARLEKVLARPALASLKSCVSIRHRLVPGPGRPGGAGGV